MRRVILTLLTLSLLHLATVAHVWADDAEQALEPFLSKHCIRCHGEEKQKGKLRLDNLPPDFASSSTAGIWIEVMDNLNLGEMPPDDEPQPSAEDHAAVVGWIASQLREAQKRASSSKA